MVAMVQTPADLPSAPQAAPASPAPTQIRSDIAVIREAHAADNVDKITKAAPVKTATGKAKDDADTTKPTAVARRAERMARMDAKVLDDSTPGDISATAKHARARGARSDGRRVGKKCVGQCNSRG